MKYDAFISYRHTELDKKIAIKLHKILETYKAPSAVRKKSGKKKLAKIFRDQDELPTSSNLSQSIDEALSSSEYLIVICSPDTPKSSWVLKEIDTFIKLRGHDKILALLIAGEPEDSFPPNLRFITNEQGETVEIEPLAADIRADGAAKMDKLLKREALRILAPIFGCSYDDLRQRHRERRIKAVAAASAVAAMFFAVFGSYSIYQNIQINRQSQKTLESQSLFLANLSSNLLRDGDRQRAMLLALEALPANLSNPERPLVSEAVFALCEAAGVYKNETNFTSSIILKHKKPVNDIKLSDDGKIIVTVSSDGYMYVWDGESGKELGKFFHAQYYGNKLRTAMSSNGDMIYYISDSEKVIALNKLNEAWSFEQYTDAIALSHDNKILAVCGEGVRFYDAVKGDLLFSLADIDDYVKDVLFSYDDSIVIVNASDKIFIIEMDTQSVAYEIDNADMYSLETKLSRDGKYFYNCGFSDDKNSLTVYETLSGDVVYHTEIADDGNILTSTSITADFCEDDSNLLLYSVDNSLIFYNLAENEQQASYFFAGSVSAIIPLGDLALAASEDGVIRFFNVTDSVEYDWYKLTQNQGITMMKRAKGTLLTASDYSNDVHVWKFVNTPNAETISTTGWNISVSPNGEKLAYETEGNTITVIDLNDNTKTEFSIDGKIYDLRLSDKALSVITDGGLYSFGYDGEKYQQDIGLRRYVYYSNDNSITIMDCSEYIYIYDTKTCGLLQTIDVQQLDGSVQNIAISPDKEMLLLIASDGKNILYSLKEQKYICTFEHNNITAAAFNDSCNLLALSNEDGIYIYDLTTFQLTSEQAVDSIVLESAEIKALQFIGGEGNKNEGLLLAGFEDYSTVMYSIKNASGSVEKIYGLERLYEFDGSGVFSSCIINKEYNIAILVDEVNTATVLDLSAYKKIAEIQGFYGFTNNNKMLVSSNIEIMLVPYYTPEMLVEEAKRQLNGVTLSDKEKLRYFIIE